jgi:Cytidylate kinase-like family
LPVVIVTISWQIGIEGERIGALVGRQLELPVVDDEIVDAVMAALRTGRADASDMERFVPTWGATLAVSLLATAGMPAARADLVRAECAHEAVERVLREAARHSCVIMGRGGFALLADHPGACHVRLTAPAGWRAARLAARECMPHERAARMVESDDRNRACFVRHYYERRLDDPANFHLVLAADRYAPERVADIIAAAVTSPAAAPARVAEAPAAAAVQAV